MKARLPLPPRGRSSAWVVALGIALVLALQPMWPDRTAIGVAGAIVLTLAAATRWQLRWLPVLVLILCGMALRFSVFGQEASDVADVTQMAILTMNAGSDPYGFGYFVSRPPGAPFPYGPVALLWYLPFVYDPKMVEFLVSVGLMSYFGMRAAAGRPIGLAIFALAPPLVLATMDGSNDTSAGLLILAALAVAATRPVIGAGLLAVAVAFKPYALAWLPGLIAWSGLAGLAAFVGASIIVWSPVLFLWGPASYLRSLSMAQTTHLREAYWSLGSVLDGFLSDGAARVLETIRYGLAGATAVIGARLIRSIDGVIVVGTLAFLIAQFAGYFGSYVYLAAVAPVLCWRVDDWLRMGLPELARAYGIGPAVGRRLQQAVVAPAPAPTGGTVDRASAMVRSAARGRSRPRTTSG